MIDTEKSLMPSASSIPGITVLAVDAIATSLISCRLLIGESEIEPDLVGLVADQAGRDGHHQVDRRLAGVRLGRHVERRGVRDLIDDRLGRRRGGDALDEPAERRTDPADDDAEATDTDVQDPRH